MKHKQLGSSDWKALLQPMIDITEINRKAAEKFAELQSNYMTYLLDANVKQLKALAESKDIKSAMEQQLEFIKEVDTKWCDTAEQEIATARDAQQSINDMLTKSYARNSDFLEKLNTSPTKH